MNRWRLLPRPQDCCLDRLEQRLQCDPSLPMMADDSVESLVLSILESSNIIADTYVLALEKGIDHQTLVGAIKSLLVDRYVTDEPVVASFWELTAEGAVMAASGSPEMQVFSTTPSDGGISMAGLQASLQADVLKIGLGACMKNKWLRKEGDNIFRAVR